jgi:membrane associated rhomboid family serine protease
MMMRGHPQSQRWMESLYLSPLWLLSYYLLSDLGTIISTPTEWSGSVAYWAHIGGGSVGILMGLAFKMGVKRNLHHTSFFDRSKSSP